MHNRLHGLTNNSQPKLPTHGSKPYPQLPPILTGLKELSQHNISFAAHTCTIKVISSGKISNEYHDVNKRDVVLTTLQPVATRICV